jgi:hypothetical protein
MIVDCTEIVSDVYDRSCDMLGNEFGIALKIGNSSFEVHGYVSGSECRAGSWCEDS